MTARVLKFHCYSRNSIRYYYVGQLKTITVAVNLFHFFIIRFFVGVAKLIEFLEFFFFLKEASTHTSYFYYFFHKFLRHGSPSMDHHHRHIFPQFWVGKFSLFIFPFSEKKNDIKNIRRKDTETFTFSLYVRIFDEYRWEHGVCIDSAVGRGSRKRGRKISEGKIDFSNLGADARAAGNWRRKSSVARKNEGNKVERSNENFRLGKNIGANYIRSFIESKSEIFLHFVARIAKRKNSNEPCFASNDLFMINFYTEKRYFIILITRVGSSWKTINQEEFIGNGKRGGRYLNGHSTKDLSMANWTRGREEQWRFPILVPRIERPSIFG